MSLSLFADDLKIYSCYKVDASHDDVQTAIDRLIDWARLWQLQIAIPKCLGFRIINPQWKLANTTLKFIDYNVAMTFILIIIIIINTINNKLYYIEDNVLPFSCSVRKRFSRDHFRRGRSKPSCRNRILIGTYTHPIQGFHFE